MARTSLHSHCFHLCSCPRGSMLQRSSQLCVEGGRTCTNGTTETAHGCTPAFPCTTAQNGHSTTLFGPDPRRITCAWNRRLILVPPQSMTSTAVPSADVTFRNLSGLCKSSPKSASFGTSGTSQSTSTSTSTSNPSSCACRCSWACLSSCSAAAGTGTGRVSTSN